MRHSYSGNQLGRPTNQAKGLYRSLLSAMITHGSIETTKAKAQAVRSDLDKIIMLGKNDNVNNRRMVSKILGGNALVDKLFKQVSPAFADVTSGFTRIIKSGTRFSDMSQMVLFEMTRRPVVAEVVKQEVVVQEENKPNKTNKTNKANKASKAKKND